MKRAILLDEGIVFNEKMYISWDVFFNVIGQLTDYKIVEKLNEGKKDRIKFDDINRSTQISKDEMLILGIKDIEGESFNKTQRRIKDRINRFNKLIKES